MEIANPANQNPYGPIQPGFSWAFSDVGYQVLTGANDSGKSALLQMVFVRAHDTPQAYGASRVALLLSDREYVQSTTETGGRNLEAYNGQLRGQIASNPMPWEAQIGIVRNELPKLLLTHYDFMEQVPRFNDFLGRIGVPKARLRGAQQIHFEDIIVINHGSGVRSLLAIAAALTDPQLRLICIDEPELSLEPRLQKSLRDLLIENASDRAILVATHSHLFLNREQEGNNHIVTRGTDGVSVRAIQSREELFDVTFGLLGSDTEDLFFPGNYLVTEGASDQVICEAILRLQGVISTRVKVLAAGGATKVDATITSILNSLKPLVVRDSPYASRVVALIDQPEHSAGVQLDKLVKLLDDRLFILPAGSLEDYLPEDLFKKAGRDKAEDLREIQTLRRAGDHKALGDFKRLVSTAVAAVMTTEDVELLPVMRDAARKAANWKEGQPSGQEVSRNR